MSAVTQTRRRALLSTGSLLTLPAVALVVAIILQLTDGRSAPSAPQATAEAFLRAYVEPSGRVVRRDQGGDTVSEGQAYGLLIAEAAGDGAAFDRIWTWTERHLQLPNGELAYRTNASGTVISREPASDADLLTAWALSRATGPRATADHAQARRIAAAILANETITRPGMSLLAAGPWATGSPGSLDPSYWAPRAFAGLARFTHDPRWSALARSSRAALASLTGHGATLPPDWARVDGTTVSPTPAPNGSAPQVRYGLDAQRVVVQLAASCDRADVELAARWWPILSPPQRAGALALSPQGRVLDAQTNPLPLVAAAAAAGAAGHPDRRAALLAAARRQQQAHPTYYGAAWLALGENLLPGGGLAACPTTPGGTA